jgi:hypothetical protein
VAVPSRAMHLHLVRPEFGNPGRERKLPNLRSQVQFAHPGWNDGCERPLLQAALPSTAGAVSAVSLQFDGFQVQGF